MKEPDGVPVSSVRAITLPAHHALAAIETILGELTKHPGSASLALEMHELHVPLQAMISVPIEARVFPSSSRNEWHLEIRAVAGANVFPTFEGTLAITPAGERGSELHLDGTYHVPLNGVGRAIDATLMRGAAEASIQRFVREIAHRAETLARWANLR